MGEVTDKHDIDTLRDLIERHTKETGSKLGKKILADFDTYITSFKKIIPNDYQRMMTEIAKGEARGLNHDESVMEAFKVVTAGN